MPAVICIYDLCRARNYAEDRPHEGAGALAVFADGFRTELERLRYTLSSREDKLAEVARLSAWLEKRKLDAGDICSARLAEFFVDNVTAQSGRDHGLRWPLVAMRPAVAEWWAWMLDQRGLTEKTIAARCHYAARFLDVITATNGRVVWGRLDAPVINAYVAERGRSYGLPVPGLT